VRCRSEIVSGLERPASVGIVGGLRPPDDPLTSWLGQVRAVGQGEEWPTRDGTPLAGICQIRTSELPHVPPALRGVALITVFLRAEEGVPVPPSGVDDHGWEVRVYENLDRVVPVDGVMATSIRPFPVRWQLFEADLPSWEDAARVLTAEELAELEEGFDDLEGPADGLKVGGWPSLIQGEIYWAPWNRHPRRPGIRSSDRQ
jgi:Domain of unknown function (DUF1963)